jgi:hypothetical protein
MNRRTKLEPKELHTLFLSALGDSVISCADVAAKPLELDLTPPLPHRVRLYMFNVTSPPGGRTLGEHKIQLIMPGQSRGLRGNFDFSGGRFVLVVGYESESDVLVFWDADVYESFAYSSNLQVRPETIFEAIGGYLSTQERRIRGSGGGGTRRETVIAVRPTRIRDAITLRLELAIKNIARR